MVIEVISLQTMAAFGTVMQTSEMKADSPMTQMMLSMDSSQSKNWWVSEESHCLLNPIEGISIVYMMLPDTGTSVRCFLLDQTIRIHPGVHFSLASLYDNSQVALLFSQEQILKQKPLTENLGSEYSDVRVSIGKVYTVLEQEKPDHFRFSGEKHGFWELTYVTRGSLDHEVDGAHFRTMSSQLCLYSSFQNHVQWTESLEGVSFITVTFELKGASIKGLENEIYEVDESLNHLFEQLLGEYKSSTFASAGLVRCYLEIIILLLLRQSRLERTLAGSTAELKCRIESAAIRQLTTHMKADISHKWTLAEMASMIYVSPSYLSILFKRELGETPMEWLNRSRMEEAAELLIDEKLSVTACAERLGFASIHYFSRVFKQWYHHAPSEYVRLFSK